MEADKLNLRHISHAQLFRGPKPMPAALIAGLRARCDSVGRVVPLEDFEAGQSEKMHSGPFAKFIKRIRIFCYVKETRVQVDRQQIQAVAPAAE